MTHDEHIRFCGESLTWSHIANLAIHAVLFLQYVTMRIVYRKGPEIDEVEWNCILRATIGRASKTKTHISHSLAIYSLDFTFVLAIIMTYNVHTHRWQLVDKQRSPPPPPPEPGRIAISFHSWLMLEI